MTAKPLESADELSIKHRHFGIEDDGLTQPRDGLRQIREALGELLALPADELDRSAHLVVIFL